MAFAGVSYVAIVAAVVVSFVFGGVWYGLLSKPWLAASGRTEDEVKGTGMIVPMVVTVVAELIMAWVLAGLIGHLGAGQVTVRNGIVSGAFCWLGFVVTTLAVNHAYQGEKRALTLIDGGHWLGVLLIQGAILGLWGLA